MLPRSGSEGFLWGTRSSWKRPVYAGLKYEATISTIKDSAEKATRFPEPQLKQERQSRPGKSQARWTQASYPRLMAGHEPFAQPAVPLRRFQQNKAQAGLHADQSQGPTRSHRLSHRELAACHRREFPPTWCCDQWQNRFGGRAQPGASPYEGIIQAACA